VGSLINGGKLLHVGCGGDKKPEWMEGCKETRLDIDVNSNPDIVANMTEMGDIGKFNYVLSRHSLEHLAPHDVDKALKEFLRVLEDGGCAIVFVPDLQDAKATEEVLFVSPAGPITGLDLMYGFRPLLEAMPYMAHKTGFIQETIEKAFKEAGFKNVKSARMPHYELSCVGYK